VVTGHGPKQPLFRLKMAEKGDLVNPRLPGNFAGGGAAYVIAHKNLGRRVNETRMRRRGAALLQLPPTGNTPWRRLAAWYRLIGGRVHSGLQVYS